MNKFIVATLASIFSSGAYALNVKDYQSLKGELSTNPAVSRMLSAYHQGIAETLQSLLVIEPRGRVQIGKRSICMAPDLMNAKTVETAIFKALKDQEDKVGGVSPTVFAIIGLSDLAPCN